MQEVWGIIVAAGSGSRLANAGLPDAKQFIDYKGAPLYWESARIMNAIARLRGIIFVFPPERAQQEENAIHQRLFSSPLRIPWRVTQGGAERQQSVLNALAVVPESCDAVLIHDAARPFASPALYNQVLDALEHGWHGVVPGIAVVDTIKEVSNEHIVTNTPARKHLRAVQTPQGFLLDSLRKAHAKAIQYGWCVTDDATLLEQCNVDVLMIEGEDDNTKITTPKDMAMLTSPAPKMPVPCVGWGYDVHRYGEGRPMKLGGVLIPNAPEIIAHSDGDVLLHALCDALLGCIGAGDIGQHFPDTDPSFDNISSVMLLDSVLMKIRQAGCTLTHVDITIIAQTPKVAPWRDEIHQNLTRLLNLPSDSVNVKATTEEGLGFTGERKGIKAVAAVTGLR